MAFPAPSLTPPSMSLYQLSYGGLVFAGVDPAQQYQLQSLTGIDGADFATGDSQRSLDQGEFAGLDVAKGRDITLQQIVRSVTGTTVDQARQALGGVLTPQGATEQPLYIRLPSGVFACMARPRRHSFPLDINTVAVTAGLAVGNAGVVATTQWHATDPRWYAAPTKTATVGLPAPLGGLTFPVTFPASFGGGGVGGILQVINAGWWEMRPILIITGPCTNPTVQNLSIAGAPGLTVTMSLAAGDTLAIDTDLESIIYTPSGSTLGSSRRNLLRAGSTWFNLPARTTSQIEFTTSDGTQVAGTLTVQSADAYLTIQMAVTYSNPFTYPAWDLTTMTQLDSLPYTGVQFGDAVNQPGPWTGSLPIADPRIQAINWEQSSRTGKTLLCADLNGVVVWGGIIWTRVYSNDDQHLLKIGASTVGSYFTRRLQAFDYSTTWATATDPMTIAKQVVQDALTVSTIAGGITLTLNPAGGSGQTIVATYPGTQLQTIEQIVSNLAQMGYTFGFDYSFDVAYTPGTRTPAVTMNFWYPRRGRTAAANQLVLVHRDILPGGFTYPEDSTQQANEIDETGGGNGGIQPIKATASTPGYPTLQQANSYSDVNDEGILSNIALNDLALSSWQVTTPTARVPIPLPDASGNINPAAPGLALGTFIAGDNIRHRIDPISGGGTNTSPRFPHGLDFEWRINSWTVSVPDQGLPVLDLDLSIPPAITIPPPQPPLI